MSAAVNDRSSVTDLRSLPTAERRMHQDHDGSLKSWLLEALAAFCPVNVARAARSWIDAAPAPIEVEARELRRQTRRD